jgi:hypothetical protein
MRPNIEIGLYGAALLVVALACGGKKSTSEAAPSTDTASTSAETAPTAPSIVVQAKALVDEYKANEVRADAKYKGKQLQVVGAVADIKKDILNNIYVTLGSGAPMEFQHAQAFFDDDLAGRAAQLNKGDVIAVRCSCEGLLMNVLLKHCTFINLPGAPSGVALPLPPSAPAKPPPRKGRR